MLSLLTMVSRRDEAVGARSLGRPKVQRVQSEMISAVSRCEDMVTALKNVYASACGWREEKRMGTGNLTEWQ